MGFWKKRIERDFAVRLDANNLWQDADDCIQHLQLIPRTFWAIEEPLQPRDFDGLQAVANALNVRIVLDESCTSVADLHYLKGEGWICNLRVSKMGGIIRSTAFANAAKQRKIDVVVGAHVGETSLLTRASLAVVQHLENEQLAVEGAFGTHLLSEDLTSPCIMFDDNAQISLDSLEVLRKPGLGLFVEPDRLVPLDG